MRIIVLFACLLSFADCYSQFGYGFTFFNDIYHRYTNDSDDTAYKSAGSAIINLAAGPKVWLGGQNFSVSAEAAAGIGVFGLALKDYKGMGTAYFPMLVCFNFKGLSGLDKEGRSGFSIGGGIQYSRTELYGLTDKYNNIERNLFRTYIAHVGYGFGLQGFSLQGFGRYGFDPDSNAQVFSIGMQWDFNVKKLKKLKEKASQL